MNNQVMTERVRVWMVCECDQQLCTVPQTPKGIVWTSDPTQHFRKRKFFGAIIWNWTYRRCQKQTKKVFRMINAFYCQTEVSCSFPPSFHWVRFPLTSSSLLFFIYVLLPCGQTVYLCKMFQKIEVFKSQSQQSETEISMGDVDPNKRIYIFFCSVWISVVLIAISHCSHISTYVLLFSIRSER